MQSKLTLLKAELPNIDLAAQHLSYSLERCADLDAWKQPTEEQLERLESLAARFARLSDLLMQRIFRLIDDLELNGAEAMPEIYAAIVGLSPSLLRATAQAKLYARDLLQIRQNAP